MTNPIPFLYSCSTECMQDPKTCNPLVALALGLSARDEVKCIRLLRQMLDLLPMGVWVLNGDGGVLYSNPTGRKQLSAAGLQDSQLEVMSAVTARWRKCGELVGPHEWSYAKVMITGKAYLADEIQLEYADGSTNFIDSSALPVHDAAGEVRAIMVVNLDISSRIATEEALRSLAETDMLTGANTRRKFFRLLDLEIERHTRYSRILSAIIFDIDHFKRVNDHHGHLAGDDVLTELGRLLMANIRKADHFCRLGGEEFVVLLPETTLEEAVASAEKLRALIEQSSMPIIGKITCSFGVSQFGPSESGSAFLRGLDQTMYQAKQRGRNQVAF